MRDRPDALMLFAAGLGTRMAPLTRQLPKPLVEVAGRPLLDHALEIVRAAGVRRVVANVHYKADAMESALRDRGIEALREPVLLETGGGLRNALPHLGPDPVMTLNTDSVWTGPNPIDRLRAAWSPARMDALLLLVPPDRAVGHTGNGDFVMDDTGRLIRGPGLVFTGLQILRTDRLSDIGDTVFSLNRVWDQMLKDRRLYGLIHAGGWCDVGRPESIAQAEAMLRGTDV